MEIIHRAWRDRDERPTLRGLDRLDDRLPTDVHLRREHLTNGATRIMRR